MFSLQGWVDPFKSHIIFDEGNFSCHNLIGGGGQGPGTQESKDGRWVGSRRRWSGMRESCEGRRQEKNEGH